MTRLLGSGGIGLLALSLWPIALHGQSDATPDSELVPGQTVVTTPDGRYDATVFQRFFLGSGHRDRRRLSDIGRFGTVIIDCRHLVFIAFR